MDIFLLTLQQLMMMASLMVAGFLLRKKNIVPENTGVALSKLETYIFVPALSLYNMMTQCTVEAFKANWTLMLYGLVIIVIAILVSYPLSKIFVRKSANSPEEKYQRNIYKYAKELIHAV